jgi:hypothetical protein
MGSWNWLRLITAVAGAAAVVASVLIPPAAAVLLPIGTGLAGLALSPPGGTAPKAEEKK